MFAPLSVFPWDVSRRFNGRSVIPHLRTELSARLAPRKLTDTVWYGLKEKSPRLPPMQHLRMETIKPNRKKVSRLLPWYGQGGCSRTSGGAKNYGEWTQSPEQHLRACCMTIARTLFPVQTLMI